jgi:dienelactone hydrolase
VAVAEVGGEELAAGLVRPEASPGLVVFAHGSGSSRLSPRNRYVAGVLNDAGFATLLVDLLTRSEEAIDEQTGELRFDIRLLGERVLAALEWVGREPSLRELPVGLFGASTGAGAALVAAAHAPAVVRAVVSRGGRPDLARDALREVKAPTLLLVGSRDEVVLDLNRQAVAELIHADAKLEIVPDATHLFPERGALERVSELARAWFERHLPRS